MAIYHCSIKIGSRGKGQSAVAASAYRAGAKQTEKETGNQYDYTRKSGIVFSEISLCRNAPPEYQNREILWNAVHKIENAKNARLWREIEIALPQELDREKQITAVREYVKSFCENGMCADCNIHDKGDGNPHVHIMFTTRSILKNGEWAPKSRKVYELDENGNKIYQRTDKQGRKQYKSRKEDYNNWNETERAEEWRSTWADVCNKYLSWEKTIDHRSYRRQNLDTEPTVHEGYVARKIERNGGISELCELNRKIKENNARIYEVKRAIDKTEKEIKELQNKADQTKQTVIHSNSIPEVTSEVIYPPQIKPADPMPTLQPTVTSPVPNSAPFDRAALIATRDRLNEMLLLYCFREETKIDGSVKSRLEALKQAVSDIPKIAVRLQMYNEVLADCNIFQKKKKQETQTEIERLSGQLEILAKVIEKERGAVNIYSGEQLNCRNPQKWFVNIVKEFGKTKISALEKAVENENEKQKLLEKIKHIDFKRIQALQRDFKRALENIPVEHVDRAYRALQSDYKPYFNVQFHSVTEVRKIIKEIIEKSGLQEQIDNISKSKIKEAEQDLEYDIGRYRGR